VSERYKKSKEKRTKEEIYWVGTKVRSVFSFKISIF